MCVYMQCVCVGVMGLCKQSHMIPPTYMGSDYTSEIINNNCRCYSIITSLKEHLHVLVLQYVYM